jgi:hypothetical protein
MPQHALARDQAQSLFFQILSQCPVSARSPLPKLARPSSLHLPSRSPPAPDCPHRKEPGTPDGACKICKPRQDTNEPNA